jgi:anti-sigma regulatory factor (Ser/Thr protein kinase)
MTRTGAGLHGFRHELLLYRSAEDLVEFVVPLARAGVAEEEPTLLLLRDDAAQAVLRQVGPSPYLTVEPALAQPGRAADHVSAAGSRLPGYARVVHQEPVFEPSQWPEWRRLEAVLNLALRHHDTWAVCAYDRRTLTPGMVEDLYATHPVVARNGEYPRNDRYRHPVDFLVRHGGDPPDPIERTPPEVELVDASPATARATVKWFSRQRLPDQEIDKLIFATHETVLNALRHGRPPTVLRLWARPGRVTVTVTDAGSGPTDPLADLAPAGSDDHQPPGPALGLWLIHRLVDVTRRLDHDGYTVCLTATHRDCNTS